MTDAEFIPTSQEVEPVAQIGGDHYKAPTGLQHWDICEKYDVDCLAYGGTKYVARFGKKGKPREDLEKGRSFFFKMLTEERGSRRTVPFGVLDAFCAANDLNPLQRRVINLVLGSTLMEDVQAAVHWVNVMIRELP